MKRLVIVLFILLWFAVSAFAGTIPMSGTIRLANGNLFTGSVRFILSYSAAQDFNAGNIVVASTVQYAVNNGVLPANAVITPNDTLSPMYTWYTAQYINASGALVAQNTFYITGQSFNLGTATPTPVTTSNISFNTFNNLDSITARSINNIQFCNAFTGTSMGAKIIAAEAALPGSGGVIDCRGMQGPQTIPAQINIAKPTNILFGTTAITCSSAVCFNSTAAFAVVGGGRDNTSFIHSNATQTVFQHAAVSPFQIKDLTIQGSSGSQTGGADISINGSGGSNSNFRSIVDNIQFLFPFVGVQAGTAGYWKINNCDFNGIQDTGAGIRINNTYNSDEGDGSILNNFFNRDTGNNTYGIEVISGSGLRIANNKFQDNFKYATYVHWTGQGIQPNTVMFNYVDNLNEWPESGGAAVYFDASSGSLVDINIVGNRFISIGDGQNGIEFAANDAQRFVRVTIVGNLFDFILGDSTMVSFDGNANGDVAEIASNVMYGGVGTGHAVHVTQTGSNYSSIDVGQNQYQGTLPLFSLTGTPDPRAGYFVPDSVYIGGLSTATSPTSLADAITVPNNLGLSSRNAANTGSKSLIRLNSGDTIEIGASNNPIVTGTGTFLIQSDLTASTITLFGSTKISGGAGVPAGSCVVGSLFLRNDAVSSSTALYSCYPANTWNAVTIP